MQISGDHSAQVKHNVQKSQDVTQTTPVEPQPTAGASTPKTDAIELSSRAKQTQRIHDTLQDTPEVRDARVAEAKRALAEGTLNLNGQDLAAKLLDDPLHNAAAGA